MGIVKYKGYVMTEVKYKEVKQAEAEQADQATNLMEKLNLFFFDAKEIELSDWLWFYGTLILMAGIALITFLITL